MYSLFKNYRKILKKKQPSSTLCYLEGTAVFTLAYFLSVFFSVRKHCSS